MLKHIHLHHQVKRQLTAMEKQNNSPAFASGRAKKVIDALILGRPLSTAGLLRPRTDRRLKNSLKFDLGSGFRLICIRKKDALHVMFFGDHDSCDTWLTHHGRKKLHKDKQNVVVLRKETPAFPPQVLSGHNEHLEGRTNLPEISQKDLRIVFKGLLG